MKKIIFIGGCPRSGTTMLGAMLGSSERNIATPESQFKEALPFTHGVKWEEGMSAESLHEYLQRDFRFRLWGIEIPRYSKRKLSVEEYRDYILDLVDSYAQSQGIENSICWIDHTPENLQYFNTLTEIFPQALFIHLVRDPRAIASSVMKLDWGPNTAKESANFWAANVSFGLSAELFQPNKVLRLRYEDVVERPKETIKNVCRFADIDFDEAMLKADGFQVPDYTRKQHLAVGDTPDRGKVYSWEKSLKDWQIYRIEQAVGDLMGHFGYERVAKGRSLPGLGSKLENGMQLIFGRYVNRWRQFLRMRKVGKH
ncbi:MAG: sulfotransferase [Cyclobacteriaceae bacterium]